MLFAFQAARKSGVLLRGVVAALSALPRVSPERAGRWGALWRRRRGRPPGDGAGRTGLVGLEANGFSQAMWTVGQSPARARAASTPLQGITSGVLAIQVKVHLSSLFSLLCLSVPRAPPFLQQLRAIACEQVRIQGSNGVRTTCATSPVTFAICIASLRCPVADHHSIPRK